MKYVYINVYKYCGIMKKNKITNLTNLNYLLLKFKKIFWKI